mmetsp:Transcript_54575/g.119431  ORF Transcript_54575/g.119431 Transcript_54575/m.119431 type:complete len:534 (+) Transcript_54575:342-1943(+)
MQGIWHPEQPGVGSRDGLGQVGGPQSPIASPTRGQSTQIAMLQGHLDGLAETVHSFMRSSHPNALFAETRAKVDVLVEEATYVRATLQDLSADVAEFRERMAALEQRGRGHSSGSLDSSFRHHLIEALERVATYLGDDGSSRRTQEAPHQARSSRDASRLGQEIQDLASKLEPDSSNTSSAKPSAVLAASGAETSRQIAELQRKVDELDETFGTVLHDLTVTFQESFLEKGDPRLQAIQTLADRLGGIEREIGRCGGQELLEEVAFLGEQQDKVLSKIATLENQYQSTGPELESLTSHVSSLAKSLGGLQAEARELTGFREVLVDLGIHVKAADRKHHELQEVVDQKNQEMEGALSLVIERRYHELQQAFDERFWEQTEALRTANQNSIRAVDKLENVEMNLRKLHEEVFGLHNKMTALRQRPEAPMAPSRSTLSALEAREEASTLPAARNAPSAKTTEFEGTQPWWCESASTSASPKENAPIRATTGLYTARASSEAPPHQRSSLRTLSSMARPQRGINEEEIVSFCQKPRP